jgi:hypothetical protein
MLIDSHMYIRSCHIIQSVTTRSTRSTSDTDCNVIPDNIDQQTVPVRHIYAGKYPKT